MGWMDSQVGVRGSSYAGSCPVVVDTVHIEEGLRGLPYAHQ